MTNIIIPIKSLSLAKQRLAGSLTPRERMTLVLAMLDDLLATVVTLDPARILVVASDDAVFEIARKHCARPVPERQPTGLNAAVRLGLAEVPPGHNVAVLPGDIPLASGAEIAALAAPTEKNNRCIRLAPSRDLRGTNGLFITDRDLISPAFGLDSFAGYKKSAHLRGIHPEIVEAPGLALDIDTSADLIELKARTTAGATHDCLGLMHGGGVDQLFDRGAA